MKIENNNISKRELDSSAKYLDIAAVMILAINKNYKISLINKKGLEILGYKKDSEHKIRLSFGYPNFQRENGRAKKRRGFRLYHQAFHKRRFNRKSKEYYRIIFIARYNKTIYYNRI